MQLKFCGDACAKNVSPHPSDRSDDAGRAVCMKPAQMIDAR